MGVGGQINVCPAAFIGVGAYASAILTSRFGYSHFMGMMAGMAFVSVVALFIGYPSLKLELMFLAIVTLGFGIIIQILLPT